MNKKKGKLIDGIPVCLMYRPLCCYCKKECFLSGCFSEAKKFTETENFNEVVRAGAKLNIPMIVIRKKRFEIDVYFMGVKKENEVCK